MSPSDAEKAGSGDDEGVALPPLAMLLLAVVLGVAGGFGAIAFKSLLALVHNALFQGRLALGFDMAVATAPSVFGAFVILVPVLGALLVTLITRHVAPEARGGGVPEVLDAIYYGRGRIRPVVALAKAAATAVSIGTGGSAGREGPMVQIGATVGSLLGAVARIPARQRITLMAACAAAGVAATFNTPIGGIAFALELLLVSLSARTVSLVAISAVVATAIGRMYGGLDPAFNVPGIAQFEDQGIGLSMLLLSVPFGLLVGLAAAGFIRGLYAVEDRFERHFANPYLRHMAGMLLVGIMLYGFMLSTGNYYVAGVGYPVILDVLRAALSDPFFLMLLFAAKLLATLLTLGSGASGGVFAPSLFLGATLGGAFGGFLDLLLPGLGVDPVVFAVAGMAGMIGGTSGAVITAITMTLEQTRDYGAMLPVITTVALAHMLRVRLVPQSIYTLKLARRGHSVPQSLQAAISSAQTARSVMSRDFELLDLAELENWKTRFTPGAGHRHTVVCREGEVLGVAQPELLYLLPDESPETLIDADWFGAEAATSLPVIMRGLRVKGSDTALVFNPRGSTRSADLVGVITSREIGRNARDNAELME